MQDSEIIERIAKAEQRLDNISNEIKSNRELTIAVKEIATEMKYMREEQNKMNERLKAIEDKPLKEYEDTKQQIRKQVIAFATGILLTAIGFALGLNKFM